MTQRTAEHTVDLSIGGMTCSSCAARIEKKLNRLDGVTAAVNYATEQAAVRYDPRLLGPDDLIAVVERTGYTARLPEPRHAAAPPQQHESDELAPLRQRLLISAALTLP